MSAPGHGYQEVGGLWIHHSVLDGFEGHVD